MDSEPKRVSFSVDGKAHEAVEGESLLAVLRRKGYEVPSLCYHEAIKPFGACRLCLVEVEKGDRRKLTTSCNYPVQDGIEVLLDTPDVVRHRRIIFQLLLAMAPEAESVRELAETYGVLDTPFAKNEGNRCILCGLCSRVCHEVVGADAIALAGRGTKRKVVPPYDESNDACIACGACAFVCPTGAIQIEQEEAVRRLSPWHREVQIQHCVVCGRPIAPVDQLDAFAAGTGIPRDQLNICVDCRLTTVRGRAERNAAEPATPCKDTQINHTIQTQRSFS